MEALIELCDLIANNPNQFSDKLAWICNRCPQPDLLLAGSPRVTRSQLNAVLAVARFLSKCGEEPDSRAKSLVLEFFRAVPSSFHRSFWPQAFSSDSILSFFTDFLGYLSKSTDNSSGFAEDISAVAGEVVLAAINHNMGEDSGVSRAFLLALSRNFPPILASDANTVVTCLFDKFAVPIPASPREQMAINSENSSSQSSPLILNHLQLQRSANNESESSPGNEVSSHISASSVSINGGGSIIGGVNDVTQVRQQVASYEEESVESLEKQDIAFKLITHILDKVQIDSKLLEQVRLIAKKQLHSLCAFMKVKYSR